MQEDNSDYVEFDTTDMVVMVDEITPSGSAFAFDDEGECVFINARIAERLNLKEDMLVKAQVIPNYPDKREYVPFRAVFARVVKAAQREPIEEPKVETAEALSFRVMDYMSGKFTPQTTASIAKELDANSATTCNACEFLFRNGRLVKAEVYTAPSQSRPSFNLWANNLSAFR